MSSALVSSAFEEALALLEQVAAGHRLTKDGVELSIVSIKVSEILVPETGFRLRLRRPLTLRARRELEYWLVDGHRTRIYGTHERLSAALLDYMSQWQQDLEYLEANEASLAPGLLKDLEKLRSCVVPTDADRA